MFLNSLPGRSRCPSTSPGCRRCSRRAERGVLDLDAVAADGVAAAAGDRQAPLVRALADVAPGVAVEDQVQRGRAGRDVDRAGVGDALDGDVAHRAAERAAREGRGGAGLGGDGDARGGLGAAAPVAVVAGGQQHAVAALGAGEHAGEGRGGGVQVRRGGGGRQDEQDGQRDERKGQDRCGACMVLISKLSASASARARWCDRTRIGGGLDRSASCPEAHYQRFMRGESSDRHAPLVCESLYPSARPLCQFRCRLAPVSCRRGVIPPLRTAPEQTGATRSGEGFSGSRYLYLEDSCLPAAGDRESPSARAPARAKLSASPLQPPPRPPCSAPSPAAGACPRSCGRSRSRWRPTSSMRPRASSPSARIPQRWCTPTRSSRSSAT